MKAELKIDIACTPDHLWPWIEEPEKQKQWMEGLLENNPTTDGPTHAGSTFEMKIKEGRKVSTYDGQVIAYDRPNHMAVMMSGEALRGVTLAADYRLEDLGGGTRLHYTVTSDSSQAGFMMKLMEPMFALFGKSQARRFLNTLKQRAEATAAATA